MSWESMMAEARKKQGLNTPATESKGKNILTIQNAKSENSTKWDSLISEARRKQYEKRIAEHQQYIQTDEYKWASENESRLKKGLGYNVNNGQIYSFEPLTTDSLKKSIDWADSEIEKLKSQGASTDWFTAIGNFGLRLGGMEGVDRKELNQQLSDLQSQRAVYQKYLENAEYEEAMAEIKKNGDGESFSELFAIDSRKKTFLDALSNIGSGNIIPSGNSGDIAKEAEIEAELKNKYGENYDKFRELYGKGANNEFRQHLIEKMKEDIDEHPVLGTVGYTLGNVVTAPVRGIGAVSDSLNKAMGNYGAASGSLFQDMSEATVQKVNENINKTFKNDFAAGFVRTVYNAAVSGAESMISMGTFGKMGEAILGLNAATSTYKAGKERGLSDGQALVGGIAAGIFESLFEHMSLENLRMFKASPVTSLKPFIKNVIKQAGIEGIEEIGTDLANEAYDYFVNGGLSQYEEALRSGMTAEEYGKKFGLQLLETGLTGALSGGGMIAAVSAPTAVSGTVNNIISDRASGEFIRQTDEITETLKNAKETGGLLGSRAARIEKRITDGKSVSNRTLGEIERKTIKKERASAVDKILASEEFKELSGKEKNAIRSSVLTFFSTEGQVSEEQAEVLKTENGKNALKKAYEWAFNYADSKTEQAKERKSEEIRTAVFEGNTEKLVKNSFDAVNIDGHRVEIGAVKDITDGELELIQDKETGATAKLSEIRIEDEEIGGLYAELQKSASEEIPMTVEAVNVALSMYNRHDNTSGEAYAKWAYDAFKAGSLKINDTVLSFSEYEEMMRGDISKGESNYTSDITKSQLRQMYELGAKSLVTKPGVTKIGTRGLSTFQAEQVFILSERAKKLGLEIVLVTEKLSDGDGRAVNALYMEGTNRVVLSLQSDLDLLLVHAGHEIFHWAKSQNKEMTQYLQNMVVNVLKSDSRYDYDGILKQVSAEYEGLAEEDILEEIAAQYMGVVFADESSIRKTVEEASEQERGFLKKVIDYLKDFIKSLKELIRIYGDRDKAVRAAVETPVEQLEYFAETFERILEETAAKKKPATDEGGVKASFSKEDIAAVQSFAKRTSVNDFTSAEIEKTKAFAEIFYKDIKEKSPFFRAWFGDWREYDTTPVTIANKKGSNKVPINNKDTGWDIQVSRKVFNETKSHRGNINISARSYLEYINDIVQNAVLLDSFTMDKDKSENSLFMHSFYAVADIGNGPELLKLYVEEMNNPNVENTSKRAYQLQNIEKQQVAVTGSQMNSVSRISQPTVINTVSDLYKAVKSKDKNFRPKTVNPAFLNEDGTPKVYYHGTNARWTEYDLSKNVNQMWGEGIYLTPDYNRAKLYGDNVMPFYVRALVDNRTAKKTGQKRDHTIMKNGDVLVYSPEQIKSATDNIGTFDRTKKDIRYSYAGVKAKTADIKTLDYAARLEDVGKATAEEIRQQTGWFRGYDNKWRFEISDRDMQIDTRGLFSMNPDVRRYTQLVDKAYFDMTATEEEMLELVTLEKNLEGVSVEPKTLGELIHHPALFEAYPQLKDIKVYFEDIEPRGAYNPVFNEITLQKKLKLDKSKLTKTLVHEIQHAVQEIEGFAGGASTSYWEAVYRDEYRTLEGMKKNLDMWLREIGFIEYVQKSMQQVISKEKTMAQHWEDLESFKQNSRYAREIASCENAIEEFKKTLPDPADLYERTAGEIEARDAALRHWRTDEARKEKRPDIDRTDVVFAEGEILSLDIKTDADGNKFVDVNPDLFDARDGESHAKTIARIIKDRFDNLISVNGQQIQINKTTNDEWRRSNGADALQKRDTTGYFDKLKTIPHADEILKVAKNWIGEELHHPRQDDIVEFARGNIYYRVGNNGYVADVLVGIRKNGAAILYDLDDIREKTITDASLAMASESPQRSAETSVTDNISQGDSDVNKKYSRQRINESWEDIRTKMYENEVHEEIIGEIEAYIDRLKNRKFERETEITEGLIPKYEAILKVAREYTKGSDVSAHQLADTINELMWAAHDGNLDTKQFIATVRLITEDIIRTGRKINDDKYRQYEDFRRMTREETVFVERRVYNQYVEEYGSVKNLNRACAGKIKIKPYEDGNRTGRALDDFYGELREAFPELFKEEKDVYHQLYEILAAWNDIQPTTEYFSEMLGIKTEADIQTQSLIVAEDILSDVLGIKEAVKTLADKYANKLKYQQEHYKELYRKKTEEGRRNRREAEERALLNKRITRNTNRLSDMLRNETDERHIPEDFKDAVKEFLNIFIVKNEEGREVFVNKGTLNMVNLGNAYKAYYAGEAGSEMSEYDEDILGWINELAVVFGQDINIKKLSLENLRKVDNIVTHFCHIIKTENEIFINGRREKFTVWANTSIDEMWNHVKKPEYETEKKILDAEYGMLTPIYFFKLIGTTTKNGTVYEEKLFKMFRDLQDGQDKWFRNISSVKDELSEIKKKYKYSEDWKRDAKEFTLSSGETIKLTVEEILYMRALNIRETGHINRLCHLLEGGIIVENDGRLRSFAEKKQGYQETKETRAKFDGKQSLSEDDITTALKKNITYEDLIKIFATLTENQEVYSEALVDMLSTKGAELGNEVSLELVGIRKFTEKNYIPISVAESFLKFSVDKRPGGAIRLKNRSFTKRTTQNANATVYVRSITDVAAEHMQEMSLYNAMTIPIENLTRVFNYQKPDQEEFTAEGVFKKTTGNSYKELFKAVYGRRGIQYFENFLEDINGGNQTVSRDFMSKMMGMFKKSAVTGSLSVAIQQPSAIVRATALIDPKYFVTKPYSQEDYNEMLRYCPVAGIKEIGRFDTGTGLTATEWILNEKGGFSDKADEFLSYLPGWMDRRTWVYIWEAVKKETADKTNKKGEDILKEAAERFRDVIDYTQVYDSTLSRSAYMRDKGTGARMATAFLAEPTLSYNMVRDALMNAKNDKKQAARSVAAFAGATLLNALLKSVITALRQDDEETNYFELYLSEVPQSFIEDVIIVNSLPVVKDIISIFKGYDVSRSDMTLFSNVYNAFRVILKEDHIATWDEWFVAIGALSALVGIPLNNVLKDFTAVVKTVGGLGKSPDFSIEVLGQTIAESFIGKKDDSVKLYRAILNGNKKIVERYLEIDDKKVKEYKKQGYSEADALAKVISNSESNFHSKVVEGLISEDIRIKEAAEARLDSDTEDYEKLIEELAERGFDKNDIIKAIDKYIESMKDKTYKASESKDKALYSYEDLFRAIDSDNMKTAKYIFEELTKAVSKATVQNNIRDEYSEALYIAILNGDNAEQERLQKIFKEFEYDHHYAVILGLRENDERIYEAAEARYKGDTEEYESIKEELLSDGFDENDVFNAVEAEAEKLAPSEEKKESHPESSYLYEAADLKRYAESFNLPATTRAIQNFRDGGKEDSGIRSSLTSVFKKKYIEAWQSGNDALIIKIRDFLIDCDVGYSSKQFSSWEKEALGK